MSIPNLGLATLLLAQLSAAAIAEETQLVVIRAGHVITVTGQTFSPGMVVIEDGKIRTVGSEIEYPAAAHVIDAGDQTVMPGLIQPRSRYGLPPYNRSGLKAAHSAADEVVLETIDFRQLLEAGYTTVAFYPAGSGLPGAASVYRTAGDDDDAEPALKPRAYLRVTMSNPGSDKKTLTDALDKAQEAIEKIKKAREEWEKKQQEKKKAAAEKSQEEKKPKEEKDEEEKEDQARVTAVSGRAADEPKKEPEQGSEKKPETKESKPEKFTPPKIDPHLQPFVDLLEKKEALPLVFELSRASDLLHLKDALRRYPDIRGSFYLTLSNFVDYRNVLEKLSEQEPLVVLAPAMIRAPYTVNRYNLAATLARAGCRLVFVPLSEGPTTPVRIRAPIADLVRAGLSRDAALKALTHHPAQLLGIDAATGSLAQGKDADLIFLDGDPLDPGSEVQRVMIGGKVVWSKE